MIYSAKQILFSLATCLILLQVMPERVFAGYESLHSTHITAAYIDAAPSLSYLTHQTTGNAELEDNYLIAFTDNNTGSAVNNPPATVWQRIRILYQNASTKAQILLGILGYLIISILVLFAVILINRHVKTRRRRWKLDVKNEYQEQLAGLLFDDSVQSVEFKGIKNQPNREILIDELRELHSNLHGESADKLRDLYFNLELHKDSLRKVYKKSWHHKSKGFKEVAQMDVKDANDHIISFVNDKNPIIRVEAQVAMVKLSEESPLAFLDDLKHPLSEWEQVNIYDSLVYHQINIDSFEPWLDNANPTVVVFALRMITLFKHIHSAEAVKHLLFHENQDIRLAAVNAIKALEVEEYIPELKELFNQETRMLYAILEDHRENEKQRDIKSMVDLLPRKIRYAIVSALETIAGEQELVFLADIAKDNENSFKLRMLAIKIMTTLGSEGEAMLQSMIEEGDELLKTMITNVKENPEL